MLASVPSCALLGVDAFRVAVEVAVASGLPGYHVVGLPATSVKEGAVRIRAALEHVGMAMPAKKITVNLAPADRRKSGAAFDLPIALGILVADGVAPPGPCEGLLLMGELGLDGSLRPVRGALSAALLARATGLRGVLLPAASAAEAAVVEDIEVFAISHLRELVEALSGEAALPRVPSRCPRPAGGPAPGGDMSEVRGQEMARAALEVAVAGSHNLLLVGPPGMGKTMLSRRIPSILPPPSGAEILETTQIYSAAGLAKGELIDTRPYRAPHHSISTPALLGGGSVPRPGEISLAHNGVLFLDELPEFRREAIESLRQPLEDRTVTVGRVHGTVTMPASFLLVASANPCPCGWSGSRHRACVCSPGAVARYHGRLSGPILDRIDLQIFVQKVELMDLRQGPPAESSDQIRARVIEARNRQARRLAEYGCRTNAEMSPATLRATCRLTDAAEDALARLDRVRGGMTARSVDRLIRVARTIADLHGRDPVDRDCVCEAAAYRALDSDAGARSSAL
ncbi:YifB family Mg chelatase-like AAA ATPase [Haliangium sp.]|uniref:YifB family Mg chelatase-like AAA ATPase n=1 Tax=Haliangium sp. TaxID=2663208 RepID=UPI003D10516B